MKKGIIGAISLVAGVGAGAALTGRTYAEMLKNKQELADKHLAIMLLYNQWMLIKQDGKSIISFFHENDIREIAIYGMSYVGERLYAELQNTDICIKYVIDKKHDCVSVDVPAKTPDDFLDTVDAIIVTAVYYFDEIKKDLAEKTDCKIISLEDILYEL